MVDTNIDITLSKHQAYVLLGKLSFGPLATMEERKIASIIEAAITEQTPELTDLTDRALTITIEGETYPYPKIGDVVAVRGGDDYSSGAATVSHVHDTIDEKPGHPIPTNLLSVSFKEIPGLSMTWVYLYNAQSVYKSYADRWSVPR